jgi:hypothetical protein
MIQSKSAEAGEAALTEAELHSVSELAGVLRDSSRWHIARIGAEQAALLTGKLLRWPVGLRAAPLDLLRVALRIGNVGALLDAEAGSRVVAACEEVLVESAPEKGGLVVAGRVVLNLFTAGFGRAALASSLSSFVVRKVVPNLFRASRPEGAVTGTAVLVNVAQMLFSLEWQTTEDAHRLIDDDRRAEDTVALMGELASALSTLGDAASAPEGGSSGDVVGLAALRGADLSVAAANAVAAAGTVLCAGELPLAIAQSSENFVDVLHALRKNPDFVKLDDGKVGAAVADCIALLEGSAKTTTGED